MVKNTTPKKTAPICYGFVYRIAKPCPECNRTGKVANTECTRCKGIGEV